jgi:N-acyl-D-aspartate/D-glutamate deacylase
LPWWPPGTNLTDRQKLVDRPEQNTMLDLVIRGATLIDGTGAPGRSADVGVRDGRVVAVTEPGAIDESAAEIIDADGLMLAPGFIDPHTHYDAQLFWDPYATPSSQHGVTTVIAGNCGFTLAPIQPSDADWVRRMMAQVEGMPLAALENGLEWDWRSFGEYLDRLEGRIGVNAAFLVGHTALRRLVMGPEGTGSEAAPEQIEAMADELRRSIEAGGIGFSSSLAFTHSDGDGEPVPSRSASREEVLALCGVMREYPGTTLETIVDGCINGFTDDEIEYLTAMSLAGRRPINWNVLTVDSREPERFRGQLRASEHAEEQGARIVALTMPILVGMNMSFGTHCALFLMPGWGDILRLPLAEKMAKLADPTVRADMQARAASDEAGGLRRLIDWGNYRIGDTFSEANAGLEGRLVSDIAAERGTSDFDTLVDIAMADELRTVLWPLAPEDDDESWRMRAELWSDGKAMLGGSDAGAHLDRMCGAPYPTIFLGDCLRGRKLVPVEEAVRLMTEVPAQLFGLRDRGRIAEGAHADLVLFDPDEIGAGPIRTVFDLPGNTPRLTADALGVRRVIVAGETVATDGETTGALPGSVLRSGRDTDTVEVPGPAA